MRANVSTRQVQNGSGCLLSLRGLDLAVTRTEHLIDGVGTGQGKAFCEGATGKLLDGILHSLNPTIAFRYRDTDVGVLVEHLIYRDQVRIAFAVTVRRKTLVGCGVSRQRRCVPDLVVE